MDIEHPDYEALHWWRDLPPYIISMREAVKLPEYSATNPTGVSPGKRWRRHNGVHDHNFRRMGGVPRWIICTYEEIPGDNTMVLNGRYRAVIRVKMGRRELYDPVDALRIIAARDCENYTTGLGSCYENGRTPDAKFGAERCCTACIADSGLKGLE